MSKTLHTLLHNAAIVCCLAIACGIVIFILPTVGSESAWQTFHSHFGNTYPNNHVYQALLTVNAEEQAKREDALISGSAFRVVTDDFRRATAGESFPQFVADFKQLGYQPSDHYLSGHKYLFTLDWEHITALKIPQLSYSRLTRPDIEVSVIFHSDTNYQVDEAVVANHMNTR